MDSLLQDVRYALRTLIRTPGFTIVAGLALALGIGANTAIFTMVHAVLLQRLPFKEPDRIVALWEESGQRPGRKNTVGPSQFVRWSERATTFDATAGLVDTRANLTGAGNPREVIIENVTSSFFPILGVPPALGRVFTPEENADPEAAVVVLTYDFWQGQFAGDPGVIGRAITLNTRPHTVVGVMPRGFRLFIKTASLTGKPADVWRPYVLAADARNFGGRYMEAIARLKPGVPLSAAQAEMTAIAGALATETPERNKNWGARVLPLHDELSGEYRRGLLVLTGAVAFVLLVACANVANLMLARGAARRREIAIRAALGAARGRVIRQLLTESFILAAIGGGAGLLVAQWGLSALVAISPVDLTQAGPLRLSGTVLLFTAAVSVATAIVSGLAPAFDGSRTNVHEALEDGTRQVGGGIRHRRLRQAFVVSEVALAVVLLIGAGLLLRSLNALWRVNPGYNTSNILTIRLQLPGLKYREDGDRIRFFNDLTSRLDSMPGVQAAGAISYLPLSGLGAGTGFTIEGQPPPPAGQDYVTSVSVCDNGYLRALNVPLLSGRLFSEREMRERSNVVIVSQSLVRAYFPNENPIGKRLAIVMTDPVIPTEIIGVVGDVRFEDITSAPRPTTYWPHPQLAYGTMTLTVRTVGDPLSFAPAVERMVRTLDKDQPVSDVKTMDEWVAKSLGQARFNSLLLAAFAGLAMLLAAIGIYGVVAHAVRQRTAEIGVRLALGAEAGSIVVMIVGNAMRLAGLGLAIGVVLGLALGRTLTALLYETASTDAATFTAVVLGLSAVALISSYLPARRAARIEPVEALRFQ